jgi:histidinol phosphatase-like PHP family hydrolase
VEGLNVLPLGVRMARKGWLEPKDVVNAWELEEVEAWLAGQRTRVP